MSRRLISLHDVHAVFRRRATPLIALGLLAVVLASSCTSTGPAPSGNDTPTAAGGGTAATSDAPVEAPEPAPEPEAESSPVSAMLEDPDALRAGGQMFRAVCTGYCHSTNPGVVKEAPDLFDCDWIHGDSDDDLLRVIKQGVPETTMLPFDGKISDTQMWQLIAYIRDKSACQG